MWHATWPKLHSQQLPRGKNHAKSCQKWSQGPFSNNFFLQGCISKKKVTGTKIKTRLNYRNDYHI